MSSSTNFVGMPQKVHMLQFIKVFEMSLPSGFHLSKLEGCLVSPLATN